MAEGLVAVAALYGVGVRAGMWFGQQQGARDVVLLGAGFSKAVSCQFPLIKELGQYALDEAGVSQHDRPEEGTGFEAWLSRIGEDQPYRSVEENLAARRLFVQMSTAIAGVMRTRQRSALLKEPLDWLDDLMSVLHVRQARVVSFNYDNLVECAVDGHCLTDWSRGGGGRAVTSHDVVDRLPPLPPAILSDEVPIEWTLRDQVERRPPSPRRDADQVARSLRLLKLHGSLSWYWSPDDETGVTLQRWRTPGTFGDPSPDDDEARLRALPGRVPFIVPPTATKSSYLTNLVVREIWGRARTALAEAERLIVIGYSVPPEDQVASGMLAEALRRREVEVVIVDHCVAQVQDRLRHLGVGRTGVRRFGGPSCVEEFVAWYRDEQATAVVASLRDRADRSYPGAVRTEGRSPEHGDVGLQGQVHVDWGRCNRASCRGRDVTFLGHSELVDLQGLEDPTAEGDLRVPLVGSGTQHTVDQTQVPTLLRHLSGAGQVRRLVVQALGRDFPVVDYLVSPPSSDVQGRIVDPGNHLTLVPSGHPRR